MIYLGVDPGLDGAMCGLREDGSIAYLHDIPTVTVTMSTKRQRRKYDIPTLAAIVRHALMVDRCVAAVELVHPMPKEGAVASFSFGYGSGVWDTLLLTLGIPLTHVAPQQWRAALLKGRGVGTGKGASILRARQLWPEAELYTPRHRPLDGRAEALLIAEWSRQQRQAAVSVRPVRTAVTA